MSTFEPTSESASRLGVSGDSDLSNLNTIAGFVAVVLLIPGLFSGAGPLVGTFIVFASLMPPIGIALAADRRRGPRSARITFIAAGVFLLMIILQVRG